MAEQKLSKAKFAEALEEFNKLDTDAKAKYQVYKQVRDAATKVKKVLVDNGWEEPNKAGESVTLKSQAYMQEKMNRRHKMSAVQVTSLIAIASAPRAVSNKEIGHMLEPFVKFKNGDENGGILRTLLLTLERNGALKTSYAGKTVVFGPTEHTKPLVVQVLEDLKAFGIEAFSKHENVVALVDVKVTNERLKEHEEAEAAKAKAKTTTAAAPATPPAATEEGETEKEEDIGL